MATDFFPVSDLSPQFLNASWADIVEAEELEDFKAIERLRCTSSSSLSDKENQEQSTPFTLSSSITRIPLSAHSMENHCVGVTTTRCSNATSTKRPVKRSYADAVQPSRAKRTNASLPSTPTSDDAFSPSSSSCPSELSELVDECTPEANEKCEGSSMVPAQRRLSFTMQRSLSCNSENEVVLDEHRLQQRQKQLDYGKNTPGYQRYITLIPKWKRTKQHPKSPNKYQQCSKRSWDGQIKKWRRMLHAFDPPSPNGDVLTVDDVTTAPVCRYDEGEVHIKEQMARINMIDIDNN